MIWKHTFVYVLICLLLVSRGFSQQSCDPVDCIVSGWNTWSDCSQTCGENGTRQRIKTVFRVASCGGSCSEPLEQTEPCNIKCCPKDCVYSDWTKWGLCFCDKDGCEGGAERYNCQRARRKVEMEECGGYCDDVTVQQQCGNLCCLENCIVSAWSFWGICQAQCEQPGIMTRVRHIEQEPRCHGKPCGILEEAKQCMGDCCPVDCVLGEWSSWSKCNVTCGESVQTRARFVQLPDCNGKPCSEVPDARQTRPCSQYNNVDCLTSTWTTWSDCFLDNGFCGKGLRSRSRTIERRPECQGQVCGNLTESSTCYGPCCIQDCVVSEWTEWGHCSTSCGQGISNRTRSISQAPSCGGSACPTALLDKRDCVVRDVIDCEFTDWSTWSACSTDCGVGIQGRTRTMVTPAYCGGKCENEALYEEIQCESYEARQDCEVSEWSEWGRCVRNCAHGVQTRNRSILVNPVCEGTDCPMDLVERRDCHPPCGQLCNMGVCSCNLGYRLGSDNVTCSEIVCPIPKVSYCPPNHRELVDCRHAYFRCAEGYKYNKSCSPYCSPSDWTLKGTPLTVTCQSDGTWTQPEIFCARPNKPPTGIEIDTTVLEENKPKDFCFAYLTTLTEDEEYEIHVYTIINDVTNRFYIRDNRLCLARPTDYEEGPAKWEVTFRSTDIEGEYVEKAILFEITNANDPPTSVKVEPSVIPENSPPNTVVGCLNASDDDENQNVTLTLVDSFNQIFATFIDENTGKLCIKVIADSDPRCQTDGGTFCTLNKEVLDVHYITILAMDDGLPPMSAYYDIPIRLTDVNDRQTSIVIDREPKLIPEEVDAGLPLVRLKTVDEDSDQTYTYTLLDDNGGLFDIQGDYLTATRVFDYETEGGEVFEILVESVDDDLDKPLKISKKIIMQIADANESPYDLQLTSMNGILPFEQNKPRIQENMPAAVVGTISVKDADAGDDIEVQFVDGMNANGRLALFNKRCSSLPKTNVYCSATLILAGSLNYELEDHVNISVLAADKAGKSTFLNVSIEVVNRNDPPRKLLFDGQEVESITVDEGKQDFKISTLSAVDEDEDSEHTFELVDASSGLFTIESNNLMTTKDSVLDYEVQTEHTIHLKCTDDGDPPLSTLFDVKITVTDVNEQPTSTTLSDNRVRENSPDGTIVGQLISLDPDNELEQRQTFRYSLPNDAKGRFKLDGNKLAVKHSGRICGNKPCDLDFEVEPRLFVTVLTMDDGSPRLDRQDIFAIDIEDANDPPTDIKLTNTAVNENEPSGTTVGTLVAFDQDGEETLTFALKSHQDLFGIADGDKLVTLAVFDYEYLRSYRIRISVIDNGIPAAENEETVPIQILNVNEAPTLTNGSGGVVIREDVLVSNPAATLAISDPDSRDTISVAINRGSDTFSVDDPICSTTPATGATDCIFNLIAIKPLDVNIINSYMIQLTLQDEKGLTSVHNVTLNVIDVNNAPTAILINDLDTTTLHVPEDADITNIAQLGAVDADIDQTFTYNITDDPSGLFSVAGNILKSTSTLDFESTTTSIKLGLVVLDSGSPPLSFNTTFEVIVDDVNEPPINLTLSNYEVKENSKEGTDVGTFEIEDPDSNQTFDIVLLNSYGGLFVIDGTSLKVGKDGCTDNDLSTCRLNYERGRNMTLNVVVKDNGVPSKSAQFELGIVIMDVNEPPGDIQLIGNKVVKADTIVGTLTAKDEDIDQGYQFQLIDNTDVFDIDTSNTLLVKDGATLNEGEIINITVNVTDDGYPTVSTTGVVHVMVTGEENVTISLTSEGTSLTFPLNNATVAETTNIGEKIATITIVVLETDRIFTMSITSGSEYFEGGDLDCVSDEVQSVCKADLLAKSLLDYETVQLVDLIIKATADDGKSYMEHFRIEITDVNESPSDVVFNDKSIIVQENSVNEFVGTFHADGPDLVDVHTFDIRGTNQLLLSSKGTLSTPENASIDFEATKTIDFVVIATDRGGLSINKTFVVSVVDVNEKPIGLNISNNKIAEMSSVGQEIGSLNVNDPDADQLFTFQLVSGSNGVFDVTDSTLRVASEGLNCSRLGTSLCTLDYETKSSYTLTIQVTDNGNPPLSEIFSLDFEVEDVNDKPTGIRLSSTKLEENTPIGRVIGDFSASDQDEGQALTFVLKASDVNMFYIKGDSLFLNGSVDFETQATYSIQVEALDDGIPPLSVTSTIRLEILDMNEPPYTLTFAHTPDSAYTFIEDNPQLDENMPPATFVGEIVSFDPDTSEDIDLQILSSDLMAHNKDCIPLSKGTRCTWDISSARLFDFEKEETISFVALATDGNGLQTQNEFHLHIVDANDSPTDILVTIDGELVNNIRVLENTAGTLIAVLSTEDEETDQTYIYDVLDSTKSLYVSNNELRITSAANLDFERTRQFSITVKVTDSGSPPLSLEKQFMVDVGDVNEAPTLIALTNNEIAEDASIGTEVGMILVQDPDNIKREAQQFVLSITDAPSPFKIEGKSLVVANPVFDQMSYTVEVKVIDNGTPPMSSNLQLTVNILDVNDPPTRLDFTGLVVKEDVGIDSVVGQLKGRDEDLGQTLVYTIVNSNVLSTSGSTVVVNGLLNYETGDEVVFTARVTDSGDPPLSLERNFTLKVEDVNEGPISLRIIGNVNMTISEGLSIGEPVGTVEVMDEDKTELFEGVLTEGSDLFELSPSGFRCERAETQAPMTVCTVDLLLASKLDYETTLEKICATIKVNDKGGLKLTELFTFDITNENEPPRDILLDSELTSIPENTDNFVIGGLSTVDEDRSDTHIYQVITYWDSFTVIGNKLFTRVPLDYERQSSYVVSIRTTDRGIPPLSLTKTFELSVTNENEAPTEIILSHNEVEGGAVAGTIVGHVTVVDPDNLGQSESLQTHVCKLSPGELFTINSENSVMVRETIPTDISSVNISITCSDNGIVSLSYSQEFSIIVVENVNAPKGIQLLSESGGKDIMVDENMADITLGTFSVINLLNGQPDGGTFLFLIENGEDLGVTVVDSDLRLTDAIDYEAIQTVILTVQAVGVDATGGQLSLTQDFKIAVNDVNEPPTDIGVYGDSTVQENSPPGLVIGDLYTVDPEDNQTYTYTILAVNHGFEVSASHTDLLGVFFIDGKTLKVGSKADVLDYETSDVITVRVTSLDSGVPPFSVEADIHLQITDVNDPPTDISISNNVIPEDSAPDTLVGTLIVVDEDKDTQHVCEILNIIDVPFKVVNNTEVVVDQTLDFESTKSYSVKINCADAEVDGSRMKLSKTLIVNISNVNEPPTDVYLTVAEVEEGNVIGQVIGEIKAVDLDSSETVIELAQEDDWEAFAIEGNSTLVADVVFDYEMQSYYILTITATDEEGATTSKRIEIQVLDINEAPSSIGLDNHVVSESKPPADTIGTFITEDSDRNQKFTYSLDEDGTGTFVIKDSALIVGPSGLDYEKQHQHVISVTSTDNGQPSQSITVNFTIDILDTNEPPSDIEVTWSGVIPEDTPTRTVIAVVRVDDPDVGQRLSCKLNDTTHVTLVTQEAGQVEIVLIKPLDYEQSSVMFLNITCTDGEFDISKVAKLNVSDVNEAPTSIKLSGSQTVKATAEVGHVIGQLTVVDDDANQTFTFTVVGQNSDLIMVTERNELALKSIIPSSQIEQLHPSVRFNLTVADSGDPVLTYNRTFVIPITNIDIATHEIPKVGIDNRNITENSKSGTVIGRLFFINESSVDNLYMFIEENFENVFKIENDTYLVLAESFNNTDASTVQIVVKVMNTKTQDFSLSTLTLFVQRTCSSNQPVCADTETCVRYNDTYSECKCQTDFEKNSNDVCDVINNCVIRNTDGGTPCQNGGTCIDDVNSFVCKCPPGYGGERCEVDNNEDNPCVNHDCKNDAVCIPDIVGATYTCSCKNGWEGDKCETNNDDCSDAVCYNGGTCVDKQQTYLCDCSTGFKGLRCEYGQEVCSEKRCNETHICVGIALNEDAICVHEQDYVLTLTYDRPNDVHDIHVFLARLKEFIIKYGKLPTLTAPSKRKKRATTDKEAQVYVVDATELDNGQYMFRIVILNEDEDPFRRDEALKVLSMTCTRINSGDLSETTFCPAILEAARKPSVQAEPLPSSTGLIVGVICAAVILVIAIAVAVILHNKKKDNSVSPEVGRPLPSPKLAHNKVAPQPSSSNMSELQSIQ